LGNPVTDLEVINSVAGNLEVDDGFSSSAMAHLVLEFHHLSPYSIPQYTLPIVEDGEAYTYQGGGYGDVVFPVQPEDAQVVAKFLGTTTNEDAAGHRLPSPGSFTVAVENGSGLYNQGAKTASALKALGSRVTSVTDTPVPASTTEATILYANPAQEADALRLQSELSGLAVVGYDPGLVQTTAQVSRDAGTTTTIDVGSTLSGSQGADVVLVTGSNFTVNPPAAPPPSSSGTTSASTTPPSSAPPGATAATTTTSTPSALAGNPNLTSVSSSTTSLEPWDPRSCTASGGEGP
jgi:hypothetical protein